MVIRSVNHPKVKKWKEIFFGEQRNSDYFVTNHYRVIKQGIELGLLEELIIKENLNSSVKFEGTERTWISEEVANEITEKTGMLGVRFAVLKKPIHPFKKFERVLLLDNFRDGAALGSMIRSARCFGFDGILLTGNSVDPWCYSVSRSAQANLLEVPILSLPFQDAIQLLHEQEVFLVTIGKRKAVPLEELSLNKRMAILLSEPGSSYADMIAFSDIVCDLALDYIDYNNSDQIGAILMYACRNLRG